MYCPLYFGAAIICASFALVLFEPVRSADPPINSGINPLILLITISEDCLVASDMGSLINFFLKVVRAFVTVVGILPFILLLNSVFCLEEIFEKLLFHFLNSALPNVEHVRHWFNTFRGI